MARLKLMAFVRNCTLAVFCIPLLSIAQVHVGQPAPKLVFGNVIQGEFKGQDLGKPLLLEFWATWCGPCVKNIPHLNELADQFIPRGLDFISITPEDASTVERFLQTHPMRGMVALDPNQRMLKLYGAGTPTTVLIDRSGKVVRKVHPALITTGALEDLVADRPVRLSAIRDDMYPPLGGGAFGEPESDASTIVKVTVAPSATPGGLMAIRGADKSADDHMKAQGATLPDLLSYAYDLSPSRVVVSKYLQGGYYAVDAWVPNDRGELLKPMLRTALQAAVNYRTSMKDRDFDVLVLRGFPGKVPPVDTNLLDVKTEKGHIAATGLTLDWLRKELEDAIGKPVLIDNMPAGRFHWEIRWNDSQPGSLAAAVRDQLGVELVPERRSLSVLYVDTN